MKTSQKYDLNIGNVNQWRKEHETSKTWTADRTRLWFQMRDRGQQRRGRVINIYELLCVWSERFFWLCVIAGGICLTFSASSFFATILSGRLDQILGGR